MKVCNKCGGRIFLEGDEWVCVNCGNTESVKAVPVYTVPLGYSRGGCHMPRQRIPMWGTKAGGRVTPGSNGRFGEEPEFQEGLDALEAMMGSYVI